MAQEETSVQKKSREKFSNKMDLTMKNTQGVILDVVEAAIGNKEKFLIVRSKVLRACNDNVRTLKRDLERYYSMEFVADTEDIIVFNSANSL